MPIDKMFKILEMFLTDKAELTIKEILKASGLNKSIVYRNTKKLVRLGYLCQGHKKGRYSIGIKFYEFCGIAKSNLNNMQCFSNLMTPFMEDLRNIVNETISLGVLSENHALEIKFAEVDLSLKVDAPVGTKLPLYCTGLGKILLASMNDQEIDNYLDSINLSSFTKNTITDRDELLKSIQKIKKEGLAVDDEECVIGVRNLGAPIRDCNGNVIAALGIVGPSVRLTREKTKELKPILKNASLEISHKLGFREAL
jgi:IclR family transcriptional regulator, KDG regulon repressor